MVRRAGLQLIANRTDESVVSGLTLLALNFQKRDVPDIDHALKHLRNIDSVHWGAMSVMKIAENSGELTLSPSLEWVCEFTPCGMCRRSAMKRLITWSTVPERILFEAQWDAEPDVRQLARANL